MIEVNNMRLSTCIDGPTINIKKIHHPSCANNALIGVKLSFKNLNCGEINGKNPDSAADTITLDPLNKIQKWVF